MIFAAGSAAVAIAGPLQPTMSTNVSQAVIMGGEMYQGSNSSFGGGASQPGKPSALTRDHGGDSQLSNRGTNSLANAEYSRPLSNAAAAAAESTVYSPEEVPNESKIPLTKAAEKKLAVGATRPAQNAIKKDTRTDQKVFEWHQTAAQLNAAKMLLDEAADTVFEQVHLIVCETDKARLKAAKSGVKAGIKKMHDQVVCVQAVLDDFHPPNYCCGHCLLRPDCTYHPTVEINRTQIKRQIDMWFKK